MSSDIATPESVAEDETRAALETALDRCEDAEVAYHIRQALQHLERP